MTRKRLCPVPKSHLGLGVKVARIAPKVAPIPLNVSPPALLAITTVQNATDAELAESEAVAVLANISIGNFMDEIRPLEVMVEVLAAITVSS